jgi:uncharacterized protein (UPF0548 family)
VPRTSPPLPGATVPLTYAEVGATRDRDLGGALPPGYHHVRYRREIGRGEAAFAGAVETLMTWGMHRRLGFTVAASAPRAAEGVVVRVGIGAGPARLYAPCRVVFVIDEPRRKGFGYGTLPGHPESGEEAFVVSLREDGTVLATVVAFSRPALWWVRLGAPLGRQVQRLATARYAAALRQR